MSFDKQVGLNPAHEQKNGPGWVVAETGKKPEPHHQSEPEITHYYDAIKRSNELRKIDKETISHLRETSLTDELTECYNTRYFIKFATEEFDENRDNNRIAIVNIDINGLKEVNDNLGHMKGDILLKNFVAYVRSQLRKSDILLRIGGDEFVVICENTNNDQNFEENLKNRMDHISENSPKSQIPEENISFAHGVAVFRRFVHKDIYETRALADELMYKRKREMKSAANNTAKTEKFDINEIIKKAEKKLNEVSLKIRKIFKGE